MARQRLAFVTGIQRDTAPVEAELAGIDYEIQSRVCQDPEAATRKGIMVVNTPGFCTEEVSNHTLMLLLTCARQLVRSDRLIREGQWRADTPVTLPSFPPIEGQVLGLLGFGVIGRAVTRKARALSQEAARILKGAWPMSLVNPEVRSSLAPRLEARMPP